jgi:putative ABC transport system permease protein
MLKNYLKIAFRNIVRHKLYSTINISGLAVGMACCILILLWVQHELSYDRFHENIENLYRVYQKQEYSGDQVFHTDNTPGPLAAELKNGYREVINSTRFLYAGGKTMRYGGKNYYESGLCFADPSFLDMFSFPLIKGDKQSALKDPSSIVMSNKMANKYFGDENPIGKIITIDNSSDFRVTGVLKDIPQNTHLWYIDCIVPFTQTKTLLNTNTTLDRWNRSWPRTYVLLQDGTSYKKFEKKIAGVLKKHLRFPVTLYLQPVKNINLFTLTGEADNVVYIYIFSLIAFFILLIGCINFINLTTAMSKIRAKEVGLRKTFGAYKSNIISQFFIESILISLFAFILALALIELFMPILSNLSGVENNISLIRNQSFIYIIFAVVVLTSIMAGTYPAIYFTSIQPVKALKGIFIKGTQKSVFRNILVIIQFTISIFLIISTMIIYKQMSFIYGSDIGYDKHNLIYLIMLGDSNKRYETIKNEFLKNPYIFNVTSTSRLPLSEGDSSSSYIWEGKLANQSILFNRLTVDNNYIEAMGMQMASGRTFRQKKRYSEEGAKEYILNEESIRRMEIESPIGKKFGHGQEMDGTIIGIVKDFHFATLREEIEPLVIYVSPEENQLILIRISPMKILETINYLESTWQKINPSIPFSYNFLDERITRLYSAEEQMAKLIRYFALLAIFIGSIGLYGLSSFTTEQRTKEIGIRKVFGASVPRIIIMLYREFSKLAIIASVIAWPIAYVAMKSWLQGFAYRTTIGLMSFILSSAIVLIIAIATVSYRTLKAAYANPIEALRYE